MPVSYVVARLRAGGRNHKEGRALRIETVVNDAGDLGCRWRLVNFDELQAKARDVNDRLLHHERVGQGWCPCESSL